jgi:hypothetical protein
MMSALFSLAPESQCQADPSRHQTGHHSEEKKSGRQWFDKNENQCTQERCQRQ